MQYTILGCVDDETWDNGNEQNCSSYTEKWCKDGQARAGFDWVLGAKYNYPEHHCCACGRKCFVYIGLEMAIGCLIGRNIVGQK